MIQRKANCFLHRAVTGGLGISLAPPLSIERLFRSLKTEWIPTVVYMTASVAQQDIGRFLMERCNWRRPHQFNEGLAPGVAEEKLNSVSGIS
jgi:putative transposase